MYFQVAIAGLCRDAGALFKCGVATQIGSACGALTAFLLVNQVSSFKFSDKTKTRIAVFVIVQTKIDAKEQKIFFINNC